MSFPPSMLYQPTSTGSLTNTQYIAEFQNVFNNLIPESIDDYSANASEMRIQTDPGESGTESLPTTLSEELERLRFAIKEAKGMWDSSISYWYQTPTVGNLTKSSNANALEIYVQTDTFTNTILTLKTDEENSGSFYYLKMISDVNGTPSTDFSVDQDGNMVCGQVSTGTGLIKTTDITLYETTAGTGNGITITCPSSPTAYAFTVPSAPPGSTQYLSMNSSGTLATVTADTIAAALTSTGTGSIASTATAANANTLLQKVTTSNSTASNAIIDTYTRSTGTTVSARGVAISTAVTTYNTTSTAAADVTNLTVTITTSGRPVFIGLQGYNGSSTSAVSLSLLTVTDVGGFVIFVRGSTTIATYEVHHGGASGNQVFSIPPSSFNMVDTPTAGTYTYKIQAKALNSGDTLTFDEISLVAFEL